MLDDLLYEYQQLSKYRPDDLDHIHEAAIPIVHYLGEGYIEELSRFNIDISDFTPTLMSTIDPGFKRFTSWAINRIQDNGYVRFIEKKKQPFLKTACISRFFFVF